MKVIMPLLILFTLLTFNSCASKKSIIYNKQDTYWFNQIVKNINHNQLENANEAYTSLASEHILSPLLAKATLYLAKVYFDNEEYILSIFYYDEYINKFASTKEREYIEYLKLKARYKNVSHISKSQISIQNAINAMNNFNIIYPNSIYNDEVTTYLDSLMIAQSIQSKNIDKLYKKLGYTKYNSIKKENNNSKINYYDLPKTKWYKKIFE